MAYTLPIDADGCITVKATAAITTPFVFVKWDKDNAGQVIVATDEEDAVAGILMHAVAAGDGCKVFSQVGGLCPIAMSQAAGVNRGLSPTTGGYGHLAEDNESFWALTIESAGHEYDIVTCMYYGYSECSDVSALQDA